MFVVGSLLLATGVASSPTQASSTNQTFTTSPNKTIPARSTSDAGEAASTITVAGLTGNVTKVALSIYVTYTPVNSLFAVLYGPDASEVPTHLSLLVDELPSSASDFGQGCADVDRTSFDDDGAFPSIDTNASTNAPYVGTFHTTTNSAQHYPAMPLTAFHGMTAAAANGDWLLDVLVTGPGFAGGINCWSLEITTDAGPTVNRFDNNANVGITPPSDGSATSSINISGMTGKLASVSVSVWIKDPGDDFLDLTLIDPAHHQVHVYSKGVRGANLGNGCTSSGLTKFTDTSPTPVYLSAAPLVGSYRSLEPLAVLRGQGGSALNGQWTLKAKNDSPDYGGVIKCWALTIATATTTNKLAVLPRFAGSPLPDGYGATEFAVSNASDAPVFNVVVTPDVGDGVLGVKKDVLNYPGCTVQGAAVHCKIAKIPARTTVTTGVLIRFAQPNNGNLCVHGHAGGAGLTTASGSLCFPAALYPSPDLGTGYAKGKIAHNIKLPNQNGVLTSLAQFKGKYVFLQFDAVWCGPSNITVPNDRKDISDLNTTNAMGVKVIYLEVLIDSPTAGKPATQANATSWANNYHLNNVLYTSADKRQIALQELLSYSFAANQTQGAFPTAVFIDPNGKIFDLRIGGELHPGNTKQRFLNDLP